MDSKQNTVTWVHLSDLHYGKQGTEWNAPEVLGKLVEDLVLMEKKKKLHPDLLFFTGDLASGNSINCEEGNLEKQYEGVNEFLYNVRKTFRSPIPKSNVFLVPGNHDVDRKVVNWAAIKYLNHFGTDREINTWISKPSQEWNFGIHKKGCSDKSMPNRKSWINFSVQTLVRNSFSVHSEQ